MPLNGDGVYAALEREIILGRLKPRERLPEAELSRRLGVSRTLLREVFRRLEGAGLIILQPNRGVVVRDFTPQEVEEVYYLRTVLERAAVPLIIRRLAPADLKALREIEREFETACRRADMANMILTNLAFHRRLDQASGNPFLCQFLQISHLQTHQILHLAWLDAQRLKYSIREHQAILAALAQQDAARLERAVEEHLHRGKADYRRTLPVGDEEQSVQSTSGSRRPRSR
jgi:DNA-binding GntR family transcriptional regulator